MLGNGIYSRIIEKKKHSIGTGAMSTMNEFRASPEEAQSFLPRQTGSKSQDSPGSEVYQMV